MGKAIDILQGILDRHTSRKNAMSHGSGPECTCEDCQSVKRALKESPPRRITAEQLRTLLVGLDIPVREHAVAANWLNEFFGAK